MSLHKYASNVIEKCLLYGNSVNRKKLLDEILLDNTTTLTTMMRDMYGNYVIQRALDIAEGRHLDILLTQIKEQGFSLRKFTYGRHIVACVEKMLMTHKFGLSN